MTHKGKADVAPGWALWSEAETSSSGSGSESSGEASTEDECGHGRRSVSDRMQMFTDANNAQGDDSASDFE